MHHRLVSDPENDDLCANGLRVDFTNFTWPTGVKSDRGFNISFTKDIILPPGGAAGGQDGGVALSFKDNKNAYRQALQLAPLCNPFAASGICS